MVSSVSDIKKQEQLDGGQGTIQVEVNLQEKPGDHSHFRQERASQTPTNSKSYSNFSQWNCDLP